MFEQVLGVIKEKTTSVNWKPAKIPWESIPGGETGGGCVFSFLPFFLNISINLDQVATISFREIFSKSNTSSMVSYYIKIYKFIGNK